MTGFLQINTDGGSRGNPGPAAIGVVAKLDGEIIFKQAKFLGELTNNEAEYLAFISSLEWLLDYLAKNQVEEVVWLLDSKLVVEQISKRWKIKMPHLKPMAEKIWRGLGNLSCSYEIKHVMREENAAADELVNQALDNELGA